MTYDNFVKELRSATREDVLEISEDENQRDLIIEVLENSKLTRTEKLQRVNDILELFGIERFEKCGIEFQYINTGHSYTATLMLIGNRFVITSWGDVVESLDSRDRESKFLSEQGETLDNARKELVEKLGEEIYALSSLIEGTEDRYSDNIKSLNAVLDDLGDLEQELDSKLHDAMQNIEYLREKFERTTRQDLT